ncbi:MAG TPA: hypothetical protein VFJ06_10030 [Halococcus sp.]|nr:hypothetical protein [Halococcus sp.]
MKRRDVLTTGAAIVFTGCLSGGGGGDTTDNGSGTTGKPPTANTETHTSATPATTSVGTNTPQTVQVTERETKTATEPTEPEPGNKTDTPIPIPDRLDTSKKGTPLEGEAHVTFENGGSRVVVTGTITGKNGCQTAVLDTVKRTKSGLVVTIATERDAPADAACSMALVELDYRFVVRVETPPESVTVVHRTFTGKRTMTTAKSNR